MERQIGNLEGKESLGRWDTADDFFFSPSQMASLKKIIDSFSTDSLIEKEEDCMLLPPVDLIPAASLAFNKPTKAAWEERISRKQAEIEKKVEEEEERKGHLQRLEAEQKKLVLGGIFHDKKVVYNPYPWILVQDAFIQTAKTVLQLFEGGVSPKQVMGPVGMIQHLQSSWKSSLKEGVYWLGMISLNLACLNLLPLPIFDGGHVLFYLLEAITGKRLGQKTMERLAFLCMVLLILFILYVTYQDVMRLFQTLFRS